MRTYRTKTNRAFTLVEILTVIVIISILASLVTLAVAGALRSAKRARVGVEMNQIALSLEHYKAEFGEYPPDWFDDAALVRHVRKRWPRYEIPKPPAGYTEAECIRQAITNVYLNTSVYNGALCQEWVGRTNPIFSFHNSNFIKHTSLSTLCVWLGGFPDKEGKFIGFSADPEAPFGRREDNSVNNGTVGLSGTKPTDVAIATYDKKNMMELTVNKNVYFLGTGTAVIPCIVSKISSDSAVPIVYFSGNSDGGPGAYLLGNAPNFFDSYNNPTASAVGLSAVLGWKELGVAVPYAKSGDPFNTTPADKTDVVWCEAAKYQLIHPGLDGRFGNTGTGNKTVPFDVRYFRSLKADAIDNKLGQQDLDNLTNFSEYKELKSVLP